jgi:hypothetical protein
MAIPSDGTPLSSVSRKYIPQLPVVWATLTRRVEQQAGSATSEITSTDVKRDVSDRLRPWL